MGSFLRLLFLSFLCFGSCAGSAAAQNRVLSDAALQIASVVSGDRLIAADGTRLQLAWVEAPRWVPEDAAAAEHHLSEPMAETARDFVRMWSQGVDLNIVAASPFPTRWGWLPVRVQRSTDGEWLDRSLLRAGLARVVPSGDAPQDLIRLLQADEDKARQVSHGIWNEPFFAPLSVADTFSATEGFRIVEGTVRTVAEVRRRVFLNYGDDWREDFTVTIAPEHVDAFVEAGVPPSALEGRTIRVRGRLYDYNGPAMDAVHPGQIELLDPP